MTVVSKRTSRREYLIQKKLYKLVPKYVPKPIVFTNGVMKTKKCGVSLKKWLSTQKCIKASLISQIIKNVRLILEKIRRGYPGFRHMDLHIGNVLMCRGRVMLIDFGLSKMNAPRIQCCRDMNTFIKSLRKFLRLRRKKSVGKKKEESAADIAKRIAQGRLKA
jgi:tRNA A-37 threonylcarbamoyl transferase component Bud32